MAFFAVGAIALSALSSASAASSSNKAVQKDYINRLEANVATNKAIDEANLKNTIRTGYSVGILNVQRGQAKQQAVKQGYDLSAKGAEALGTSYANAAASGTVGASVDAVSDTIGVKLDAAKGDLDASWKIQTMNFDNQLNDMIQQGIDSLQSAQRMDYSGPAQQSVGQAALMGGLSTAMSFATQYGQANMNLGLGNMTSTRAPSGSGSIYSLSSGTSSISGLKASGFSFN